MRSNRILIPLIGLCVATFLISCNQSSSTSPETTSTSPAEEWSLRLAESETDQALQRGLLDGNCAAVKAALTDGANPNLRLSNGERPLTIAALQQNPALGKILLHAGADALQTNRYGRNALSVAKNRSEPRFIALLLTQSPAYAETKKIMEKAHPESGDPDIGQEVADAYKDILANHFNLKYPQAPAPEAPSEPDPESLFPNFNLPQHEFEQAIKAYESKLSATDILIQHYLERPLPKLDHRIPHWNFAQEDVYTVAAVEAADFVKNKPRDNIRKRLERLLFLSMEHEATAASVHFARQEASCGSSNSKWLAFRKLHERNLEEEATALLFDAAKSGSLLAKASLSSYQHLIEPDDPRYTEEDRRWVKEQLPLDLAEAGHGEYLGKLIKKHRYALKNHEGDRPQHISALKKWVTIGLAAEDEESGSVYIAALVSNTAENQAFDVNTDKALAFITQSWWTKTKDGMKASEALSQNSSYYRSIGRAYLSEKDPIWQELNYRVMAQQAETGDSQVIKELIEMLRGRYRWPKIEETGDDHNDKKIKAKAKAEAKNLGQHWVKKALQHENAEVALEHYIELVRDDSDHFFEKDYPAAYQLLTKSFWAKSEVAATIRDALQRGFKGGQICRWHSCYKQGFEELAEYYQQQSAIHNEQRLLTPLQLFHQAEEYVRHAARQSKPGAPPSGDFSVLSQEQKTQLLTLAVNGYRDSIFDWLFTLNMTTDQALPELYFTALSRGHMNAVKWFLDQQPKLINHINDTDSTSLTLALSSGNAELVTLLLDRGIDSAQTFTTMRGLEALIRAPEQCQNTFAQHPNVQLADGQILAVQTIAKRRKERDRWAQGNTFYGYDANGKRNRESGKQQRCTFESYGGLMWEGKMVSGEHNYLFRFSEKNSDAKCESIRCDARSLIKFSNKEQLCGRSDWRLPTLEEFEALPGKLFRSTSGVAYAVTIPEENSTWQGAIKDLYNAATRSNEKKLAVILTSGDYISPDEKLETLRESIHKRLTTK